MSKESAAWDRSVEYLGEIVVEHRNCSRDFARFYRSLSTVVRVDVLCVDPSGTATSILCAVPDVTSFLGSVLAIPGIAAWSLKAVNSEAHAA
jgi:hypothetical protein